MHRQRTKVGLDLVRMVPSWADSSDTEGGADTKVTRNKLPLSNRRPSLLRAKRGYSHSLHQCAVSETCITHGARAIHAREVPTNWLGSTIVLNHSFSGSRKTRTRGANMIQLSVSAHHPEVLGPGLGPDTCRKTIASKQLGECNGLLDYASDSEICYFLLTGLP